MQGEFSSEDYAQGRNKREIALSFVISFVSRTVSRVFKSEETGLSGTSDVPVFILRPCHHASLSICTPGEVSSEK